MKPNAPSNGHRIPPRVASGAWLDVALEVDVEIGKTVGFLEQVSALISPTLLEAHEAVGN